MIRKLKFERGLAVKIFLEPMSTLGNAQPKRREDGYLRQLALRKPSGFLEIMTPASARAARGTGGSRYV